MSSPRPRLTRTWLLGMARDCKACLRPKNPHQSLSIPPHDSSGTRLTCLTFDLLLVKKKRCATPMFLNRRLSPARQGETEVKAERFRWLYGTTAARPTPHRKVGSSGLAVMCWAPAAHMGDCCGVRTHALTDWRLKPAPSTALCCSPSVLVSVGVCVCVALCLGLWLRLPVRSQHATGSGCSCVRSLRSRRLVDFHARASAV